METDWRSVPLQVLMNLFRYRFPVTRWLFSMKNGGDQESARAGQTRKRVFDHSHTVTGPKPGKIGWGKCLTGIYFLCKPYCLLRSLFGLPFWRLPFLKGLLPTRFVFWKPPLTGRLLLPGFAFRALYFCSSLLFLSLLIARSPVCLLAALFFVRRFFLTGCFFAVFFLAEAFFLEDCFFLNFFLAEAFFLEDCFFLDFFLAEAFFLEGCFFLDFFLAAAFFLEDCFFLDFFLAEAFFLEDCFFLDFFLAEAFFLAGRFFLDFFWRRPFS